jgi:mono/diheme cytochrome c family protein
MTKMLRSQFVLAAAVLLAGAICFAQEGSSAYKDRCAMCHGATGIPSTKWANMGVKPVTDPSVKALTVDQIINIVRYGKGRMHPFAGFTPDQLQALALYFKSLSLR